MNTSTQYRGYHQESTLDLYLDDLRNYPPLSREEEVEVIALAQAGDEEAQNRLLTSNLRFVVSIALEYRGRGIPVSDLISEGNLGLMEALSRFDADKGFRFISYAVWWIRQAILKAIQGSSSVRFPNNRFGDLEKLGQRTTQMMHELGRTPSLNEVAEDLDISLKRAERALSSQRTDISLDAPLNDDEDDTYDYELACPTMTPEAQVLEAEQSSLIENILNSHLTERESEVIRSVFDFDGDGSQNLANIANRLGISRERVRQIRNSALNKLEKVGDLKLCAESLAY